MTSSVPTHEGGGDVRSARMGGGELKAMRERLSLTVPALAELLDVSEGTVKNWEKSKYTPPAGVAAEINRLEDYTRRCAEAVTQAAQASAQPMVLIWRLTHDMPPGPARTLGAPWWRSVATRSRETIPGLIIGYADELDRLTGARERTLSRAITPDILLSPTTTHA